MPLEQKRKSKVWILIEDQFELSRKANIPGPGSYTQRNKNEALILSTIKNLGCPVIWKSSHDRFSTAWGSCITPGPGNYTLRDDIGKGGHYV